jgi:hypothetical protein
MRAINVTTAACCTTEVAILSRFGKFLTKFPGIVNFLAG